METPTFSSTQEEIIYWKKLAEQHLFRVNTIQQELDEYTEGSQQLEKELETALDQSEKSNRDLKQQNQRLQNEIESLRNKLEQCNRDINILESDVKSVKADKERQAAYIRELEQKNDDLERAQRVITESVAGIETLLHQSYERNAVLEGEVDEIDTLRMKLQRAMDEARDLRQELLVTKYRNTNGNMEPPADNDRFVINGHATTFVESETQTNLSGTPIKREYVLNGNTLTPSSRVSAMNIVGDLLRKIGLEKFLCSECDKVRCICPKEEKQSNCTIQTERVPNVEYKANISKENYSGTNIDSKCEEDSVQLRRISDSRSPVSLAQLDMYNKRSTIGNDQQRVAPTFVRQISLGGENSLPMNMTNSSRLPSRVPGDVKEGTTKVSKTSAGSSPGFVRSASTRLKERGVGFFTRTSLRKPIDVGQLPNSPSKLRRQEPS